MTIGEKRNKLMAMATGEYIAFIDDDDQVSPDYIQLVLDAIRDGKPDVVGIVGIFRGDMGNGPIRKLFYHTIKNDKYWTSLRGYERPPNHLNPMRREIASQFSFEHKSMFEDTDWAMEICKAKVLKSEKFIERPIYFYDFVKDKRY
jgi:glycosyltransferase involved in cell wall biosynthesis